MLLTIFSALIICMYGNLKIRADGEEMKIGYARVSTQDQDLTIQLKALEETGCEKVFHGKQSGVGSENELKLAELLDYVRDSDVVVVTKLDRLGRSLKSILQVIENIHSKGAVLKVLDGSVNTSVSSPFSSAMVALLATFAQLERDLIVSRTAEGRKAAMASGKKMGRKPSLSDGQVDQVLGMLRSGEDSVSGLARRFGTSRTTIQRIKKKI